VGYLCGAIKDVLDARVGDTIALASEHKAAVKELEGKDDDGEEKEPITPLTGYSESVPMVFCGVFPVDADEYEKLREALGKMRLNDAAITYEPETSGAMGFGFRCGFLGLLHMDVVRERLEREYDLDLIATAPSVVYRVETGEGERRTVETVDTPSKMPEILRDMTVMEPYVRVEVLTPSEYNGAIIELGQERRGILLDVRRYLFQTEQQGDLLLGISTCLEPIHISTTTFASSDHLHCHLLFFHQIKYLTPTRSTIVYDIPLAEVITNFFDQLKSRTQGYASMEYSLIEYRPGNLVRLDVKINYEDAPPLATIVHVDAAQTVGRRLVASLKDLIPRQMFKVPIQACIGVKVVASASIAPMRKDVLAKCYGGDISRKKKLLQKQAKGKKRMKIMGRVSVPQEAFMAVIKLDKSAGN